MNPPRSLETLLPVLPWRSVSSQLPARTEALVRHRLTDLRNILKAQPTEQHAFSSFTGQAHFHKTIWFSIKGINENKEISGEYTKNQGLFYFFYDLQKRLHFERKNYSANQKPWSIFSNFECTLYWEHIQQLMDRVSQGQFEEQWLLVLTLPEFTTGV